MLSLLNIIVGLLSCEHQGRNKSRRDPIAKKIMAWPSRMWRAFHIKENYENWHRYRIGGRKMGQQVKKLTTGRELCNMKIRDVSQSTIT